MAFPNSAAFNLHSLLPTAFWRLDESAGSTVVLDQRGSYPGTYVGNQYPNLASDPSFEGDTVGSAPLSTAWTGFANTGMTLNTCLVSNTWAASGANSCHVKGTNTSGSASACGIITSTSSYIPIPGSATCTVQAVWDVIQATTHGLFLEIIWYDINKTLISSSSTTISGGATGVLSGSFTATSPSNALYARVEVGMASVVNGEVAEFYVDAISFMQAPSAQTYSDTQGVTLASTGALTGDSDTAVALDGQSGCVTVPYAPGLNTSTFSVGAWFYLNALPATDATIISTRSAPTGGYLIFVSSAGRLNTLLYNGSTSTTFGGIAVTTGAWYHVVNTYDGSTNTIYLNGKQVSSAAYSGYVPTPTSALALGRDTSSAYFLNGKLDEVAMYNYCLSPAQVALYYQVALQSSPTWSVVPSGRGWTLQDGYSSALIRYFDSYPLAVEGQRQLMLGEYAAIPSYPV